MDDKNPKKEIENDLIISELTYKKIVETSSEGIIVGDANGKMIFINQKWSDMLGYPKKEILGKEGLDFMDEDQKELVLNIRQKIRKGHNICEELKFIKKDGSVLWTLCNSTKLSDNQGKFLGFLAMHTDITKRKEDEEKIISLSRFPSENPNPVLRINLKGIVIYANPASEKLLEEIQGKLGNVIPEFLKEPLYDAIISGKKIEIEKNIKGRIFMFLIVPILNMNYANVYALDITNFKK